MKDDKDAVAAQKSSQTVDPRGQVIEDVRDKAVVQDEPVDLDREIQEEIENTDPDRWRYQTERTKELKRPEPILCDSSADSGEEDEANKEERTSDDAYFKQTMTEMGKKRNKAFMKQLGDEVLKFVERVEHKSPGDDSVHVQNARFDGQCMYRYRDELGREMIFASYVDHIICCTTDKGL